MGGCISYSLAPIARTVSWHSKTLSAKFPPSSAFVLSKPYFLPTLLTHIPLRTDFRASNFGVTTILPSWSLKPNLCVLLSFQITSPCAASTPDTSTKVNEETRNFIMRETFFCEKNGYRSEWSGSLGRIIVYLNYLQQAIQVTRYYPTWESANLD